MGRTQPRRQEARAGAGTPTMGAAAAAKCHRTGCESRCWLRTSLVWQQEASPNKDLFLPFTQADSRGPGPGAAPAAAPEPSRNPGLPACLPRLPGAPRGLFPWGLRSCRCWGPRHRAARGPGTALLAPLCPLRRIGKPSPTHSPSPASFIPIGHTQVTCHSRTNSRPRANGAC